MYVGPGKTVGDLKKLLEDVDDDMPLQGEMQGEPHYDWGIYVTDQKLKYPDHEEEKQVLIVEMDL